MATVERCPMCDRPRPRGALRCVCNYTFEYAGALHTGERRSPLLDRILGVLSAGGVIAGYALVPRDPDHAAVGALLIVAGLFSAIAAIANVRWFFTSSRARLITIVLGRAGARVMYAVLGGGLVGAGVQLVLGP